LQAIAKVAKCRKLKLNFMTTKIKASEEPSSANPVLLFDGVCNLCNASVQWVLLRDKAGVFRFTALQSEAGRKLLEKFGLDTENFDTVVLISDNQLHLRSDVPLEICRQLGSFWKLLYVFKIIPRPIRDTIYNYIAKNRYRWWGRKEECMLPRPEWKGRFLS
jgi:predicted DCC family thiol-disulfide oxidoreductase YuxK